MIDKWIDVGAAIASAAVSTYIGMVIWLRWKRVQERQQMAVIVHLWLFAVFLSMYFVLRVENLANWLDAQVPANNVSRFVAYIAVCWAAYFLSKTISHSIGLNLSAHQRIYPWAVCLILVVLFFVSISVGPNSEGRQPVTIADLLFRSVLYVYMLTLLAWILPRYWKVLRKETAFVARVRIVLTTLCLSAALGLAGVKFLEGMTAIFVPNSLLLYLFESISPVFKALIVLPFVLACLPKQLYLFVCKPYFYVQDLLTLRDIRVVERKVHKYCMPVAPESATLWLVVTNTDYFIHRSLIHILDGHKYLAGYLSPPPGMPPTLPSDDSPLQDYSFTEVNEFFYRLASVDISLPYEELIRCYRELGQQLRQEERWTTFPATMKTFQPQSS